MTDRVEQDQSELSMVRESPGSGDDLSPDGRRSWGDRRVKEDDMALDNEQVIGQAPAAPYQQQICSHQQEV
jgi:hypothetical protein